MTGPPLLANAGRTVIAAKWHLSDLINGRTNMLLLDRARAIIQAKQQVKDAYATLRKVQQNARKIRETFLEDLAEHMADTRHTDKATTLKQLL
jgi:UDP-N-acetylglucosamine:LPS N-acetylglucosamine transferase